MLTNSSQQKCQSFHGNLVELTSLKTLLKYTASSTHSKSLQKMVNTRAEIKKPQNTLEICFSHVSIDDSDQQSTQSGASIGANDDLLTEIHLRLPVTSIRRFKSVSKHWRLLLSDRHFTHRYDKLSKSPGLFAGDIYVPFDVENPSNPLSVRSLESYFDGGDVTILQSCNGLLLCSPDLVPFRGKGVCKYYVFNPTTKQLSFIPPVPGDGYIIRFMGLAFHQTDCVHYKVVCISSLETCRTSFEIQIYSSDTSKWKISIQSFSAVIPALAIRGVYWNGAVYWEPHCFNTDFLYFNIDDEQLQTFPLPLGLMPYEILTMYFGESRGHLHLIVHKKSEFNISNLNLYEMLSDRSGWFVKYRLQLDELVGAFPEMIVPYHDFKVIDVVRGEKEEDTFIVLLSRERMIRYNVHDKGFKQISSFTGHSYKYNSSFRRYIETLSSF